MNMRIITITILAAAFACAAHAQEKTECPPVKVIPAPKVVECRAGDFRFTPEVVIVASDADSDNDRFAIELLRDDLKAQIKMKPRVSREMNPGYTIVIGRADDPLMVAELKKHGIDPREVAIPEGYNLSISWNSILAAGADDDGVFYAVQTLRQLMRTSTGPDMQLPSMRIDDWPSFSFRGVMDDISRGPVPTMDTIKQTIRRLSEFKINKFNFYIEHVFEFVKHPLIGPEGGALTAEQIAEIEEYAAAFHIELIGGLQSFGHMYHILKHGEYSHLAENRDNLWEISPAYEGSYELLSDMYSEIAPAFSSPMFNISCDETWSLGQGAAKEMVAEMGIEGVYAYHINRVHEMLSGHGKRVMMWADIALKHPGILDKLPMDLVLLPWSYGARDSFDDMLLPTSETGRDFIVCPGVSCWGRIFPNTETAEKNIGNFARDGARYRAWGLMNTAWDDSGENLFGFNWMPLAWGAEVSWNPLRQDAARFRENFTPVFYGAPGDAAVKGINYIARAGELPEYMDLRDSQYWQWPVPYISPKASRATAGMLLDFAEKAEKQFLKLREASDYNTENADYLIFAARRLSDMALRRREFFKCAEMYDKALRYKGDDRKKVVYTLERISALLGQTQEGLWEMFKEYKKLWDRENRPYWLENNEKKFDELDAAIENTRKAVSTAAAQYEKSGALPPPEEVGLK